MKASGRDRQIKIERYTVSTNELNEEVKTWATLATPLAAKGYRKASENQVAAETSAIRMLRFEILWTSTLAGLNAKDRIECPLDSSVYFDISEVNEIGRHEGLEIFATARADGGTN